MTEGEDSESLDFDDIPLLDLEKEVFSECGAWKNFADLEDSLVLEELFELYNSAVERQGRLLKTVAAAFGADISEESKPDSKMGVQVPDAPMAYDNYDLNQLPFGLGYENIE